jgi:hypothetical protein
VLANPSLLDVRRRQGWWVDPDGGGQRRRHRHAGGEALWVGSVRGCEDASSRGDALDGEAVVDVVRSQQADADMVMLAVVPVEAWPALRAGAC